jgi:hypothetical protein
MPMLNTPTSGITRPPVAISGYQAPTATYSSSAHGIVTSRGEFYPVRMGGDVKWRPEGYEDVGASRLMTTNVKLPQPLNFSSFSQYFWDRKVPDKSLFTAEKTGGVITKIMAKEQEFKQTESEKRGITGIGKYVPYEAEFNPKGDIIGETIRDVYMRSKVDKPSDTNRSYEPYTVQSKVYGNNILKNISTYSAETYDKKSDRNTNIYKEWKKPILRSFADYENKKVVEYTPAGASYRTVQLKTPVQPVQQMIYGQTYYNPKTSTYTGPTGLGYSVAEKDLPKFLSDNSPMRRITKTFSIKNIFKGGKQKWL